MRYARHVCPIVDIHRPDRATSCCYSCKGRLIAIYRTRMSPLIGTQGKCVFVLGVLIAICRASMSPRRYPRIGRIRATVSNGS